VSSIKALINMSGRRALITGATGALGSVIADTFAELGASLILVDRPESDFGKLLGSLPGAAAGNAVCVPCDLESQEDRDRLVAAVTGDDRGLDVLVNNAAFVGTSGLEGWAQPFDRQTVETWRRALEVNLTAVFDLCQQFAPTMCRSQGAAMINVASIYGHLGPDWGLYAGTSMANPAAYAASKGGIVQLTRWLSTTLAPRIRVNSISPGGIFRNQPPAFVERYEARTPLGRMGSEDDFRGAFAYLASDLSKYVTGQDLLVDGGWSAW